MNYKLEKFWNDNISSSNNMRIPWTINLKSFEILMYLPSCPQFPYMNYKLEKFWNTTALKIPLIIVPWTINLKSFEIQYIQESN